MQDVHVHPGVIGDRRLRPHSHHHQALKCPRCESLNTKFCYYNNYNLSQPRHFCKNCRRYWTKGGVLRNVPVGGGCRKPKRSKPKHQPPNSLSTSDSSSAGTSTGVFQIPVSDNFGVDVDLQPLMESNHHQIGDDQVMFSSEIGGFANLMNNNSGDPFGAAETTTAAMLDPIDDLMENRGSNGGLVALDWQGGGTAGLFDLLNFPSSGGVEYWSQTASSHPHWSDKANSYSHLPLFLP